jgi:ClpP class serine protease
MKVKRTESIGEYKIIRDVEDPTPNPVATEDEAFHHVTVAEYRAMTEAELKELFNQYIIYADPGTDGELVQENVAEDILLKLTALNEHEKLQDNLEILPDWRGVEFWHKTNGVWSKQKIDQIGVLPPNGFILPDNLTEDYRREIAAQEEMNRLTNLTADQRAKEKETALKSLQAEALRRKEMAEIADEQFDAKAWYQTEAAKINEKYANFQAPTN